MTELPQLDVLIVDCQTTGATPALGSVLELGWCVVSAARPELRHWQSHWVKLPDGERVSAQVRKLTGFHESVMASALPAEEVWRRLRASTGHAPSVPTAIHFAQFELRFLRDWAERFEAEQPFPIDAVCVHQIACRLYPDLPRRNLRALAGFLGHGLHLERRSLGHAEATAFIWQKLSTELAQRSVTTWPALLEFLNAPVAKTRSAKRRYPLDRARLNEQPDTPGVYRMLRRNGDVLYVGKALSLRKRLKSHFTAGATTEQALEMLTQVSELQVTPCATALEAALLENETIKQLQPPYNVQLTDRDRPLWFSARDFDAMSNTPDERHPVGPLPSERALSALVALIALRQAAVPNATLRAAAVAAPQRFAPDEQSFAEGYARFVTQYFYEDSKPGGSRRAVLDAARKVLAKLSLATEEVAEAAPPTERLWDPDRVVRHLERALAQSFLLQRRASWLCLLSNSDVRYREAGSAAARWLSVRDGALVQASDASPEFASAPVFVPPRIVCQQRFSRTSYDRLRILSTELRRVLRDGGEASVTLTRGKLLHGARLSAVLRLV